METPKTPARGTISFIVLTAFLNLAGIGIINPVYPFIANQYSNRQDGALVVALLFTTYAFCQFLAVPTLGALSDRYGRRPVLLLSLLGSAFGYLVFGIGGALWVLFLGRAIDGITGGNLATIYAYAADITTPKERTRFFGLLGAAAGMGFVIGPALGGLLYSVTHVYESPVYFAALVTLLNTVWGYFAMPESLPPEKRALNIPLYKLNPFIQLWDVFKLPQLRLLLVAVFFWAVSFAMLQSNFSYLTEDQLGWTPEGTSAIFFVVGLVGIITQGGLIRRLLPRFGEARLAVGGMLSMIVGFLLVVAVNVTLFVPLLFVAAIFIAFGNGLITPSLTGLFSQIVPPNEQGRVQGGNQSIQALGRVVGPIWGGWTYSYLGHSVPYLTGAVGLGLGALTVIASIRMLTRGKSASGEPELETVDLS
jgi:DHA1 family tetracycline resistance protein-like MFS transporter